MPAIGTFDIFDVVKQLNQEAARAKLQIAYVDVNRKHDVNAMDFAESVACNRSAKVRRFSNISEADEWQLIGGQIDHPVQR